MRFGGFIITYNRPNILLDTIKKLFEQTLPPELIWVVDNSEGLETNHAIASLLEPRIMYFRMGYNAGPAGGAAKGLQLCAESGMDWIYWGDDNDPPEFVDTFEKLLSIKDDNPYCGILGAVGHFFDYKKGEIKRIQSQLLERKERLDVECVAGNMNMLVHSDVVKAGVLPDPSLFFGFEELDFCLKAKRRGFDILVNCELFLRFRKKYERLNFERPLYTKKNSLTREYYSLRNLLFISDTLKIRVMRDRLFWKWIGKSLYGFRFGFAYGSKNFRMIWLAFFHYWKGVKGKTLEIY